MDPVPISRAIVPQSNAMSGSSHQKLLLARMTRLFMRSEPESTVPMREHIASFLSDGDCRTLEYRNLTKVRAPKVMKENMDMYTIILRCGAVSSPLAKSSRAAISTPRPRRKSTKDMATDALFSRFCRVASCTASVPPGL